LETHSRTPNELDAGTRLSVHRTELALEGALLSIDKAEMSVLTTSLSLIGFGFTIFKFFQEVGAKAGRPDVEGAAARNFGLYLLILGMFLLVAGLYNRFRNVRLLKRRWQILYDEGLIVSPPMRTISPNMVVSILLVLGGALVILGIAAHVGPFG
jgi:putative membrane protein